MTRCVSRFIGLCALLWLTLTAGCDAADYGFRVLRADLRPSRGGTEYLLDADVDYRFSEPAIEALRNGVSLTLSLRLEVRKEGSWWWEPNLIDERYSFKVRYHALSKLFQIIDENSENPRNFVSINALLETMGTIRDLSVSPSAPLREGERYRASFSASLDIEALPLPLRPVAYLTPAWYLDSPTYKWTFAD